MSGANLDERIVQDPKICGGEAVFRGTRVMLHTVLASLTAGDSAEEILKDFPSLSLDDIRAAIAFVRDSGDKDIPGSALPSSS